MAQNYTNKRGGSEYAALQSDPLRNFRYVVQFFPYWTGAPNVGDIKFGFTSVSGLSVATEAIPYREGGMNTTLHQIPGQTTFSPVTMAHGVHMGQNVNWDWMRRLFSVIGGANSSSEKLNFRAAVDIHVLVHPVSRVNDPELSGSIPTQYDEESASLNDAIAVSFRLYNAWIQSLAYSDMNAGDNAIMVEQMVLTHEGFDMRWPNPVLETTDRVTPSNISESYWAPKKPNSAANTR
jgi:phage tail-like protein